LRLNRGIHGTFASGAAETHFGIILTQPQTFTNAAGTLNIFGPDVDNGGFDLTVRVNGGTVIFADDQHMHGAGGLIKEGPGVLRLAATEHSSYLGVTRVNEGTLELAKPLSNIAVPNDLIIGDDVSAPGTAVVNLNNAHQIADDAAVVIASSGILDSDGYAESIGALSGNGRLLLGNSFGTTFTGTSTFSGTIIGTVGALVKSGSGTLIFAGTNLHSGMVQCSAGTLQVDGDQSLPLTRITSGGRLQGSGFVGVLDINGGGAEIAPGSSPGVLTCSHYNADGTGGATLEIELNGPAPGSGYDQLNVTGTVTLTNTILAASLNFASALSNQFVIINNEGTGPVLGTFTAKPQGFIFAIGSELFRISYVGGDGNDVVLTQVSGTPARPRLNIELISPVAVRLMWPTNPPGFNLEFNTNLASPAGWLPESVLPLVVGTNNIVTNATSDAQKFYRLEKN
jgi:autotransporter-associated beta strand protein